MEATSRCSNANESVPFFKESRSIIGDASIPFLNANSLVIFLNDYVAALFFYGNGFALFSNDNGKAFLLDDYVSAHFLMITLQLFS